MDVSHCPPIMPHQYYLSPDLGGPLAAIDIGTNSIRLIIAEGLRGGQYRILDDEKETTRLGHALGSTGRLDPAAMDRSLEALRRMKKIAVGFQVQQIKAIATCAVREAENGKEFCGRIREETGLDVEIVTAHNEARLAFRSVQEAFDLEKREVLLADIGGGSTELVLAPASVIEDVYTTDLGAVRLSEQFGAHQRLGRRDLGKLVKHVRRRLKERVGKPPIIPQLMIGSGGTFTALGSMVMTAQKNTELPARGYQILRAEVSHLVDRLAKMSLKARRSFPGLSADRADIIVPGLVVVDQLMRFFKVNRLLIHTGGVRDGLLLNMVDRLIGGPAEEDTARNGREEALRRFADACGVDLPHTEHVRRLAGELYEKLSPIFELPPEDRRLLEAAAMLQDVGYLINYEDHHKHSYHLILNSDLPHFSPRDLQLIANVARYHRGARPKKKHRNFQQLTPENQRRVRCLAAILRIAGGLDRSHTQQVQSVDVQNGSIGIEVKLHSDREPEVDIWGARRRADLFERVFDVPLAIKWHAPEHAG